MSFKLHRIKRMFEKCHEVAKDSHDGNTKVGALLVHKASKSTVSEGYNGHVRGANIKNVPTIGDEKYRYMIHAEMNVILNAFQTGAVKYSPSEYTLFCTLSPCENCARFLLNLGLTEVYFEKVHPMFNTYRQGTTHPDPAKDIEGILKTYVKFPGGYIAKEEAINPEAFAHSPVEFYKVFIRAI